MDSILDEFYSNMRKFSIKVEDSFDSDNFNISDITMSFVASIIMFINYLNENNINKIEVKVNAPIRYNNHFEANERRLRYKEKVLSDSEYQEYKKMIEKQNEAYTGNAAGTVSVCRNSADSDSGTGRRNG